MFTLLMVAIVFTGYRPSSKKYIIKVEGKFKSCVFILNFELKFDDWRYYCV